jgi:hypothetical protein
MKIIKSYRDAAYSAALATDTVVDSAKFVHGQCPTFLDDAPEEVVNELNEGFMLRYSETHPSKTYCRIDGNVVENAKGKEKIEVSIYFAMSYTAQAFGALRNEDPQMHAIIKGWRDAWSKYQVESPRRFEAGDQAPHRGAAYPDTNQDLRRGGGRCLGWYGHAMQECQGAW